MDAPSLQVLLLIAVIGGQSLHEQAKQYMYINYGRNIHHYDSICKRIRWYFSSPRP